MPIKRIMQDLEDELARARLPLLGLVAKGAKRRVRSRNGKEVEIPTDLEYFRFVVKGARSPQEEKEILDKLHEIFGPQPKALTIIFPYPHPDQVFETWQEDWGSGAGLKHRCDGEHVVLWYDEKARKYVRNPKTKDGQPMPCPGGCKPVGRLHFIIPHLGRYAEWMLVTKSIHDIYTLTQQLHHFHSVLGDLTRVAFLLKRTKRQVHYHDEEGVRRSKDSWLLDLEIDPVSLHTLMANQLEERTLRALEQQRALPVFDEDVVEAEIVVDEETGEIIDEGEQQIEQHVSPQNGADKPWKVEERPWSAETVIAAIRYQADVNERKRAGINSENGIWGATVSVLDFLGDRHVFLRQVFGVESSKQLSPAQMKAIVDWVKPAKSEITGKWLPGPEEARFVEMEFKRVVESAIEAV